MYISYVGDDGEKKWLNVRDILSKYNKVFIGRLGDEDLTRLDIDPSREYAIWGLFLFPPDGREYISMDVIRSSVSRRHAVLLLKNNSLYISDHGPDGKGSTNGTYVNGEKISINTWRELRDGSRISLGYYFEFLFYRDTKNVAEEIPIGIPIRLDRTTRKILEEKGVELIKIKAREGDLTIVHSVPNNLLNYEIQIGGSERVILTKNILLYINWLLDAIDKFINKPDKETSLYISIMLSTPIIKELIHRVYGDGWERYLKEIDLIRNILEDYSRDPSELNRVSAEVYIKRLKTFITILRDMYLIL